MSERDRERHDQKKKKKVEAKRKIAKKGDLGSGILKKLTDSNGYVWKREKSW